MSVAHFVERHSQLLRSLTAASQHQGVLFEPGANDQDDFTLTSVSPWDSGLCLVHNGLGARGVLSIPAAELPFNLNRLVAGLGGIDQGIVAANTVYDVRVVAVLDGTTAGLIATVTGTAPTIPTGFFWRSTPLFAVPTDGQARFRRMKQDKPGKCECDFEDNGRRGLRVLVAGQAVISTPIDTSGILPNPPARVRGSVQIENNSLITPVAVELGGQADLGKKGLAHAAVSGNVVAGDQRIVSMRFDETVFNPPATALHYAFDAAPDVGLTVWVDGFDLPFF